ncbi:hypothetical protein JCM8097_007578 [Rhodosporidiobolus ruineniae]
MDREQIKQELLVLQASLVDGEFGWVEEDEQRAWEPALADDEPPNDDLPLPSLSLRLAPSVDLTVQYRNDARPVLAIHSLALGREEQARIAQELEEQARRVQDEDDPLPVFTIFTALQAYLALHPPSSSRQASAEPAPPPKPPSSGPLQLKVTLFWSHHLLATGKRKDIVAGSSELELFGLSKPGYPGVFIVEGLQDRVDEFAYRIKQLNWKALQVRCEQDGALVTPSPEVPPSEAVAWAVRHHSHLGPVLSKDPKEKICVKEVEGLNEVGELMRSAGLEQVFRTALKL